jgi:Glu-tRNA(Gln) amidotransferase subunit E-like FAD-binding protein
MKRLILVGFYLLALISAKKKTIDQLIHKNETLMRKDLQKIFRKDGINLLSKQEVDNIISEPFGMVNKRLIYS